MIKLPILEVYFSVFIKFNRSYEGIMKMVSYLQIDLILKVTRDEKGYNIKCIINAVVMQYV